MKYKHIKTFVEMILKPQ